MANLNENYKPPRGRSWLGSRVKLRHATQTRGGIKFAAGHEFIVVSRGSTLRDDQSQYLGCMTRYELTVIEWGLHGGPIQDTK